MQNYIKHLEYGTRNIGLLSLVEPLHEKFNRCFGSFNLQSTSSYVMETSFPSFIFERTPGDESKYTLFQIVNTFIIIKFFIKYVYRYVCVC